MGNIRNVYIASPFFNDAQIAGVERIEGILSRKGLDYFSPMRHGVEAPEGTTEWARGIFELDRSHIEKADAVVALYYGSESDSGTAWECGYACARGIPVILVHMEENGDSNLMLHCSCATNVGPDELSGLDFDHIVRKEYEGRMY